MAETVAVEVVKPVVKWTSEGVWRQLGYMFWCRSNISHLNYQVQQLRNRRDILRQQVTTARDALEIIDGRVTDWLNMADQKIEEKETSFSVETVAKAACCNGWFPNLKSRHSLGRKAKKMTPAVVQLLATATAFTTVSLPPPHPEVEFQRTEACTQLGTNLHEGESSSSGTSHHEDPHALLNFDSRRSTVGEVMEALKGNQINPIIICGMGGIGKTTLMGQVFQKAKEEGLFGEYTMATLKESLNKAADLCVIQDELARYLGLPLGGKETDARANMLRQRLSQGSKKILVMLDNVWTTNPEFLWEVGIPHSCKLLVTSRQQDLFKNMNTRKNFPIHGLSDGDAWSLFKKRAGSSVESDPKLHVEAKKVLKECAGLPIAISTVGTALKGQSIGIWKNASRELEKASPENVPGVIEHVYGKIKLSYECLPNEQAKTCLLLCCIFEESAGIPIEDLVRYGLGLGLFKGVDSMVEGRNCVETLVQTLKSRFLLLDSDNEELVRMHDVVRDVAVYIASEECAKDGVLVRDTTATLKLMDWPKDSVSKESAYCSSLGNSGICQLLLLRITRSVKPPPINFNRMEDLKVLAISGERYWRLLSSLGSLVPSLAVLRNLQTLRLEYYDFNDCDISVIGKLRKLMILSLRGSNIKQLPETFKDLSDLRLLDLTDCEDLREIAPGVISSLCQLEELYMWNSFQDWVVEKLASTETTNWISQLENDSEEETEVERWKRFRLAVEQPPRPRVGTFGGAKETLYWLKNYEKYTNWANSMDWETGLLGELLSLSRLTTLHVCLQPVNILLTTALLSKLERFWISIGWDRPNFYSEKKSGNYLRVYDLDGSVAMGSCITNLLEKASYVELKLTQPQHVLDRVCFAKTKRLHFYECNDVEHLFNPTTTHPRSSSSVIFPALHTLEIRLAERLKEIFHCELPTGSLKQLRNLILYTLPECTYIWKKTNNQSESEWGVLRNMIGHVQVLRVSHCSSLKGIIVKDRVVGDDDEEVINFQRLTELDLDGLPRFTGIISKGPEILPEDVVSPEQSDVPMQPLFDAKVHFPVLTKLRVHGMNFKEIWNNRLSKDSFCELKSLCVLGFDNLLHLVPTHMQNRLQKLELIFALGCSSLEEIFDSKRMIVDDEGDAIALTISESGDQGTQINKMVSFKQSRQAFQNLTQMSIHHCGSLRTLLSPSVARGLVKLRTLQIVQCEEIEEIVAAAVEGEETEDDNMLPQLHTLGLTYLPNLGSFSQGKYNLKWPVAKSIKIYRCGKMKKFCSGSIITSKEVNIDVKDAGECVSQELNDSRQEI